MMWCQEQWFVGRSRKPGASLTMAAGGDKVHIVTNIKEVLMFNHFVAVNCN